MEVSPHEHRLEAGAGTICSDVVVPDSRNHVEQANDNFSGRGVGGAGASAHDGSNPVGARYKLKSPAQLPISRSPCTIISPPDLSPTSFIDSPVFLAKAEPSPTSGTFFLFKNLKVSGEAAAVSLDSNSSTVAASEQTKRSTFEFQLNNGNGSLTSPNVSLPSSGFKVQHDEPSETLHENLPRSGIQVPESVRKDANERAADDVYNWRKYGQKLVKGCEFPRSYYKCTYPNCEVKKIFERAPDGQINEIVYKGTHDHPKPQPNRRSAAGAHISNQDPSLSVLEGNINSTPMDEDGPDVTLQLQRVGEEIDDDDLLLKRRRLEGEVDETTLVKPIREPRLVVQTTSEVDILDDGYRWRKYGQKVVRGNPNPRSYYKCTTTGCSVRKHVERASHDPKAVINTYEGKHNHDVPAAKISAYESGLPRLRSSDENDSSRLNHGVEVSYVQSLRPMDNSNWNNMFRPTLQSIYPVE